MIRNTSSLSNAASLFSKPSPPRAGYLADDAEAAALAWN
jgi:hypothetical protein